MPKQTFFNLAEQKRQRILNVLLEEFAAANYQEVSIDRVVERANISKGSFYQYFEDKQDCYLYLIQLAVDEKINFMASYSPPGGEEDLFSSLQKLLQAGLDFQFSNPRLGQIAFRATMDDIPLPEETRALIGQNSQDYFTALLKESQNSGQIRDEIDPELGAFVFNAVFGNLGEFILERYQIDPAGLLDKGLEDFRRQDIQESIQGVLEILRIGFKENKYQNEDIND
jgi:AcrR family transcriptional regulator